MTPEQLHEASKIIAHGRASVLIDLQYGSTGKGLFAAYLAGMPENKIDIAVTNAAPNAGHTTCYADGRKFITYHMPTFGIVQPDTVIFLNAGAIIDPDILQVEMTQFNINKDRLYIHPRAVVVEPEDKAYEKLESSGTTKLASTQKGVGRALARKVMREAVVAAEHPMLKEFVRRDFDIMKLIDKGARVMIEVPQGFDLSLNDGLSYPHCTSRSINVAQALSDAGIHPFYLNKTVGTCRSLAIRVGNIVNDEGVEVGHSGPCWPDQRELTWDELHLEPERTTVTKRIRRIFTWSDQQYERALHVLRPDLVLANFLNYLPDGTQATNWNRRMQESERNILGHLIPKLYGVGPNVEDIQPFHLACQRRGWM